MQIDPHFENNVRNSFKKAKEHINRLENEINSNKDILNRIKENISDLKEKIKEITPNLEKISQNKPSFDTQISIGNDGVLNKQTNKQTVKQTNKQTIVEQSKAISGYQLNLDEYFRSFTKQELKVFLTIYQLEEEISAPIRFSEISKHLKLSESCIRGYVKRLLEKNAPLTKSKINNKVSLFSIDPNFRSLNLRNKLFNIYYETDSTQTRLFDS